MVVIFWSAGRIAIAVHSESRVMNVMSTSSVDSIYRLRAVLVVSANRNIYERPRGFKMAYYGTFRAAWVGCLEYYLSARLGNEH